MSGAVECTGLATTDCCSPPSASSPRPHDPPSRWVWPTALSCWLGAPPSRPRRHPAVLGPLAEARADQAQCAPTLLYTAGSAWSGRCTRSTARAGSTTPIASSTQYQPLCRDSATDRRRRGVRRDMPKRAVVASPCSVLRPHASSRAAMPVQCLPSSPVQRVDWVSYPLQPVPSRRIMLNLLPRLRAPAVD